MYINYTTPLLEHCKKLETSSSKEIQLPIRQYQSSLNEWVDHRDYIIQILESYCDQLAEYSRNGRFVKTVGSVIGLVSSVIFIVSWVNSSKWTENVSVFGAVIVITSLIFIVNSLAFYVTWSNKKQKLNKTIKYVETDLEFVQKVIASQIQLEVMIENCKDENFRYCLKNEKIANEEMIEYCKSLNNNKSSTTIFHALVYIVNLDSCFKKLRTTSGLVKRLRDFNRGLRNGLKSLGTEDGYLTTH